jgi:hypothetical protein
MLIPTLTLLFSLAGLTTAEGGFAEAAKVLTWSGQCGAGEQQIVTVPDGACQALNGRKGLEAQWFNAGGAGCRRELYLSNYVKIIIEKLTLNNTLVALFSREDCSFVAGDHYDWVTKINECRDVSALKAYAIYCQDSWSW